MTAGKNCISRTLWLAFLVGAACGGSNGGSATHTISGTVSGAIADGATMTLSGASGQNTTTTAGGGRYSFRNLPNGAYTVTPSAAGFRFAPPSIAVSLSGADATGNDFVSAGASTPSHALTVAKSGSGSGTVTGGGIDCGVTCSVTVFSGTSVTLTATAAAGSTFTSWSGCDSTSGATCTVTLSGDMTVTASFSAIPRYTLTVAKSGSGSGTVTGGGIDCGVTCSVTVFSGTSVTLTATAAAGSTFTSWSGCDSTSGATCTVTLSGDMTVTASFSAIPRYTLTVAKSGSGSGTVTGGGIDCGATCSVTVFSGTSVTLTATATAGSTFTSWSGCDSASGSSCTVGVASNKTVTASFSAIPRYTLTVAKSGSGSGTVTGGGIDCGATCSVTVLSGTSVTLTATAAAGSTFTSWSGCDSTSGSSCTVGVASNKTVTASFSAIPRYTLTVAKSGSGSGTVTGGGIDCGVTCSVTVFSGTSVTLTATAAAGSTFTSWSGCDSTSGSSCTVGVASNKTVTASFSAIPRYTLTVAKSGSGSGTVTGGGIDCGATCSVTVFSGTSVTLTATAAAGSTFTSWSGCDSTSGSSCTTVVASDRTVTATIAEPRLTLLAGAPSGLGSADGAGAAARFYDPSGVAVDGAGNVYVADTDNHTIRKVTPAGVVSTLAGLAGSPGSADGTGAAARFTAPYGVAVDGSGNVYVADSGNNTIRKVTPAGVVSTLAGLPGPPGSSDGIGAAARFYTPAGAAVDGAGNVYVADTANFTIRKVTPAGVVSTLAGTPGSQGIADGTGSAARFGYPWSVAVDGAGNVYVADAYGNTIRKVTPAGVVSTFAGMAGSPGSSDGTGTTARFAGPRGVAVDGTGNVYVADSGNNTIRKVTPAAVVSTLAGIAGSVGSADGTGAAARFYSALGVAVDGTGNVYVADTYNHTVRKVTPAAVVSTLAGMAGLTGSADGTGAAARFNSPQGVAVDRTGNVYVADKGNHTLRKVTPAGVVSTLAGMPGFAGSADGTGAAARFNAPEGVAVDGTGNVYVADTANDTLRKVTPAGVVSTLAGMPGFAGSADGTGAAARFNLPHGLAVDGTGNVYVADTANDTLRKVTPAGVVSTLAGTAGTPGAADGTGAAARFYLPFGVAVDGAGNVYVADTYTNIIRKVTPAGVVSTLAGMAPYSGSADGTGAAARFYIPQGVAVDGTGNVYVADTYNNTVRKITPAGVVSTPVGIPGHYIGNLMGPLPASLVRPWGVAVDSTGDVVITLQDAVLQVTP